jgi:DUF4097 and DUF4098 domain-containing protein YvlB
MRTLLVVSAVILATSARAEEWSKRFQVSGAPELRVQTSDANVSVRASAGGVIEARVITKGWRIGPDEVRIIDHQTGSRVELEIRMPENEWNFGNRSANVELTVPQELKVEIHTGDGNINLRGLKGEFRLTSGDGDIEADSLDGAINGHTGDGKIEVRGRFDGLDLRSGDGNIIAAAAAGSKMASPWRIRSGDGGVTLKLPEGFSADIDAHTGDGEISVNLPVATTGFRSGDNVFRGKLNGGGLTLRVETGDGRIRLERL